MSTQKNQHLVADTNKQRNNTKIRREDKTNKHTMNTNKEYEKTTENQNNKDKSDRPINRETRRYGKNTEATNYITDSITDDEDTPTAVQDKKIVQQWKELLRQACTNQKIRKKSQKSLTKADNKKFHQDTISNPQNHSTDNLPFGDDVTADLDYEGIVFHNVNGLKDKHNWYQILTTMKELNISCFGLAETNTSMKGYLFHKWNEVTLKVFKVSRTITSERDIEFDMEYKPGGTLTAMVDKWQARVTEVGSDDSGMGRWSYMILSSNRHKLVIVTA
jgi:hypothetical protein